MRKRERKRILQSLLHLAHSSTVCLRSPKNTNFINFYERTRLACLCFALFTPGLCTDAAHAPDWTSRGSMESYQIPDRRYCIWRPSHWQLGSAMPTGCSWEVLLSRSTTRELWLHCGLGMCSLCSMFVITSNKCRKCHKLTLISYTRLSVINASFLYGENKVM